jgi:pyridoxine kinase
MHPNPSIICFQSLPAIGRVGLKAYAQVLSQHWVPVPSVLLNGPANMLGCKKLTYDAVGMLEATLVALDKRDTPLILVIGYLNDLDQLNAVISFLEKNRDEFAHIIIDPICGDNGKPYVDREIIENYPSLLQFGGMFFPNETEAKLISGKETLDEAQKWWLERFPEADTLITGILVEDSIEVRHLHKGFIENYRHEFYTCQVSGTGDLFLSNTLKARFIKQSSMSEAIRLAIGSTLVAIQNQ